MALTATAEVEYAAERGIANIPVSEGKVATNYLKDLAEGHRPRQRAFRAVPDVEGGGSYAKMGKETGMNCRRTSAFYPYAGRLTMYAATPRVSAGTT